MALGARRLPRGKRRWHLSWRPKSLRENPDQADARQRLGFVQFRDTWQTPFAVRQLNAGKVWHDTFGWLPKTHVARYERGERYYQGRWMLAAEEAALRRDIKRDWRVESDHYVVTTNHSLEEGVRLARRLERFYGVWRQMFAGFVESPADLARRFEKQPVRREIAQHNVIYYRNREEYNAALRGPTKNRHHAWHLSRHHAHGLLFRRRRARSRHPISRGDPPVVPRDASAGRDVGQNENFWIVEGIACYMETLAEHADYATTGGANAGRMPAARHRLLEDGFYVPLAELVRFGRQTLQQDPRLPRIYSQCAGLTDFFMHDAEGRYREALIGYLSAVYAGRATPGTLADLTDASYETLDRQYREFISAGSPTALAPAAAAH